MNKKKKNLQKLKKTLENELVKELYKTSEKISKPNLAMQYLMGLKEN